MSGFTATVIEGFAIKLFERLEQTLKCIPEVAACVA